jgi:hypothetical protein
MIWTRFSVEWSIFGTLDLLVMSEFGDEMTCGGWPGDVWSSNLLGSVSLVSNRIDIGPVRHGTVTNGIAYPWPSKPWGGSCW